MDRDGVSFVSPCMVDTYPDDIYYLLRLAAETRSPSQVVYELDPSYWMNEQHNGSTEIFFYQDFPPSVAKFLYFMDKMAGLDFRFTLVPWSCYRGLYAQIPSNIQRKLSPTYRSYDPTILDIPTGHYGEWGFIYRNRMEGENKGTFNNIPWDESRIKEKAFRYFDRIAAFCKDRDIKPTVITTPVPLGTLSQFEEPYQASHEYLTGLMEHYGLEYCNFSYINPQLMNRTMEGYWDYNGHIDGIRAWECGTTPGRFPTDTKDKEMDLERYFSYTP